MKQQILEGTWEEILQHSAELADQRVRLIILSEESSKSSLQQTLDQKLKGRVGRFNFKPSNLSEQVGEAFTDFLDTQVDFFP